MSLTLILVLFSAITFIFYGLLILLSNHMMQEFKRYNLEKFRSLTGYLEVFGGIGQLIGLLYPNLLALSSAGLSLLMLLGTLVRIRTRDPWLEMIPAILLMLINAYIFVSNTLLT